MSVTIASFTLTSSKYWTLPFAFTAVFYDHSNLSCFKKNSQKLVAF